MTNLWSRNGPDQFWLCDPALSNRKWQDAFQKSLPILGLAGGTTTGELLAFTLGESRFGPGHWSLSLPKRLYYDLKPILPRSLIRLLRRNYNDPLAESIKDNWPIDPRYPAFQWEVMRQLLVASGMSRISHRRFWPGTNRFAFVLTHDVETATGQSFVRNVADLEEGMGFRSSFNFVLERYPLDMKLIQELRERGFEVGCHGLKHDGKLFSSKREFIRRVARINARMKDHGMVGFRAPLTHRNPEWMQSLEIEYDLSFFDTDPFEPIPGGAMSIWPFFIGRFVELPYTLVQDYTLTSILGETTPRIWLEKVDFIEKYHGMALVNSHPDYLRLDNTWSVYHQFLQTMKNRPGYWHALPREVERWWRKRSAGDQETPPEDASALSVICLKNGELEVAD